MVQIIRDPNRDPLQSLARGAGQGVSAALQGLIQSKVGEIERQKADKERYQKQVGLAKQLEELGVPSKASMYLASLPPKEQFEALQLLSAGAEQQPELVRQLEGRISPTQQQDIERLQPQAQQQLQQKILKAAGPKRATQLVEKGKPTPFQQLGGQRRQEISGAQAKLSPEQSFELKESIKESNEFYKGLRKEVKAAAKAEHAIKRMKTLIEKGDLPIGAFYNLFRKMEEDINPAYAAAAGFAAGGPVGAVVGGLIQPVGSLLRYAQRKTSPDTEEFEKLSAGFINAAKDVFGSRVTDLDLKAFMQTVPTLANTDEGKKAIIDNMESAIKAVQYKDEVAKELIKQNGGKKPANFELIVEELAGPELDRLASEFVSLTK